MATNKKLLSITIFIFALLVLPISPVLAAGPSFAFVPTSSTVNLGCQSTLQIVIDTAGQPSNAADIIVKYDPNKIDIVDSNASKSGIQILEGNAFDSYAGNSVDTSTGTIKLTGFNFDSNFSGQGVFAQIKFMPKISSGSAAFTFVFFGASSSNTTDSNIAEATTSNDILASVQNATINAGTGSCTTDTTGPNINFVTPQNQQTNVASNAQVQVTISDSGSGVDISSVNIVINGTTYVSNSAGVSVSGTPASYTFTIQPSAPFPSNTASNVIVSAKDLLGNSSNGSIIFNIPPGVTITGTPAVCPVTPTGIIGQCSNAISNALFNNGSQSNPNAPLAGLNNGTVNSIVDIATLLGIVALLFGLLFMLLFSYFPALLNFIIFALLRKNSSKQIMFVNEAGLPVGGLKAAIYGQRGNILFQSYSKKDGILYGSQIAEHAAIVIESKEFTATNPQELAFTPTSGLHRVTVHKTLSPLYSLLSTSSLVLFIVTLALTIFNLYTYLTSGRELSLLMLGITFFACIWSFLMLLPKKL